MDTVKIRFSVFLLRCFTAIGLILLGNCFASPSLAQKAKLNFIVQAVPLSNLIYQLDCLSGFAHCSQGAYLDVWKSKLGWNADDQSRLEEWKVLRGKYRGSISLNEAKEQSAELPWNGPVGIQLEEKFSIATFHAPDQQSLRTHWEVIVAPTDVPKLEAVVRHFQPRFLNWWNHQAERDAESFKQEIQKILAQQSLQDLLNSFAKFYEAEVPDGYPIYLNLLFRPRSEDTHSNGTQIENHAAIEVVPGEDVKKRLNVVIHELCHFFYSSSANLKKQKLTSAFANSQDPFSLAGWGLLNEALASAFGSGIAAEYLLDPAAYKRELSTDRSFYNDAAIDAAAKALIPLLKREMFEGKTLYDSGFVTSYLLSLEKEIPESLAMPARLFTELTIIYGHQFGDAFNREIRPQLSGGIYSFEGLENSSSWDFHTSYPKLNTLVLLSGSEVPLLERFEKWLPQTDVRIIEQASETGKPWVYAVRRFPSTYVFVIGGQSDREILTGFSRLMRAKHRFTGILPE